MRLSRVAGRVALLVIGVSVLAACTLPLSVSNELVTALFNADESQSRADQTVQNIGWLMTCARTPLSATTIPNCPMGLTQMAAPQPPATPAATGNPTVNGLTKDEAQAELDGYNAALRTWKMKLDELQTSLSATQAGLPKLQDSLSTEADVAARAEDNAKASYGEAAAEWNAWINALVLLVDTNRQPNDWTEFNAKATDALKSSAAFFPIADTSRLAAVETTYARNQVVAAQNQATSLQAQIDYANGQIDALNRGIAALSKAVTAAQPSRGPNASTTPLVTLSNLQDQKDVASAAQVAQATATSGANTGTAGAAAGTGPTLAQIAAGVPGLSQFSGIASVLDSFIQNWSQQNSDDRARIKNELLIRKWKPWDCITGENTGAVCGTPVPQTPQPAPTTTPPSSSTKP